MSSAINDRVLIAFTLALCLFIAAPTTRAADSLLGTTYDLSRFLGETDQESNSVSPMNDVPISTSAQSAVLRNIKAVVDAESWQQPGVSISESNGKFTVVQTPDNQQKIAAHIRKYFAGRITIELKFFCINDPDTIAALRQKAPSTIDPTTSIELTDAELDQLTNAARDNSFTLCVNNGQTASLCAGNLLNHVSDFIPSTNAAGHFEPVVKSVFLGNAIRANAIVNDAMDSVAIDFAAVQKELNGMEKIERRDIPAGTVITASSEAPGGEFPVMELPLLSTSAVNSYVLLRDDHAVIVGRSDSTLYVIHASIVHPATELTSSEN